MRFTFCAVAILALTSMPANAATVTTLGPYAGNDSVTALQSSPVKDDLLEPLLGDLTQPQLDSLFLYTKLNMPMLSDGKAWLENLNSKAGEPNEYISGDWFTADPVSVIALKYGKSFSLLVYDQPVTSGSFHVPQGTKNALSHISFYGFDGGGSGNEVPEPATFAVTGGALLGVGLWLRRKKTGVADAWRDSD